MTMTNPNLTDELEQTKDRAAEQPADEPADQIADEDLQLISGGVISTSDGCTSASCAVY